MTQTPTQAAPEGVPIVEHVECTDCGRYFRCVCGCSKPEVHFAAAPAAPAPAWCQCEPKRCEGVGRCRWHAMGYSPVAAPAPAAVAGEPRGQHLTDGQCDEFRRLAEREL